MQTAIYGFLRQSNNEDAVGHLAYNTSIQHGAGSGSGHAAAPLVMGGGRVYPNVAVCGAMAEKMEFRGG